MFLCAWFKIPAIPTLFINIAVSTGIILVNDPHLTFVKGLAALIRNRYVAPSYTKIVVNALLTRGESLIWWEFVSFDYNNIGSGLLMELGIIQTAMEPLIQRLNRPESWF